MSERLAIAAVEAETGISKDILRMWERRYGFPAPLRDAHGNRLYPMEQIERLREIKRLVDSGNRPSKVFANQKQVAATIAQERRASFLEADPRVRALLDHVTRDEHTKLRSALAQMLLTLGLRQFVLDVVRPLNIAVGKRWTCGELSLHSEHVYTELVHAQLHAALSGFQASGRPRVLLTTLPGEEHSSGLLMAQCLLALASAEPIALGAQTPIESVVGAVAAQRADVVALSFSGAYSASRMLKAVNVLRQRLAQNVPIWLGGAGAAKLGEPGKYENLLVLQSLEQIETAVAQWRKESSVKRRRTAEPSRDANV